MKVDTITLPLPTVAIRVRMPRLFGFRMRLAAWLVSLAGSVATGLIVVEMDEEFDPADPETWTRCEEDTAAGGKIVLTRHPEGYRLRYHGEVVWQEP